jgi:hypothetical protein
MQKTMLKMSKKAHKKRAKNVPTFFVSIDIHRL